MKENIAYIENPTERERVLEVFKTIESIYPGKILEPELMPNGHYYLRELPRRIDENFSERTWGKLIEDTFVGAIIAGTWSPETKK